MGKKKKSIFKRLTRFFIVLSCIGILVWGGFFVFNYMIGDEEILNADGTKPETGTKKKSVINALICGVNENLTDTMIFIRYNVKTGKVAMMSIPRDTYVTNEFCVGNKLNAIYRGKNIIPLVKEIQELIGVKIDYYLVFDNSIVHNLVDAVGGVEVDVPLRMKYDDPTQNLHIDLQKGKQVLNGKQAEMFVRFRHNNDMTVGYSMGDLDRTKVQQEFLKAFISTVLSFQNITKIPDLINIAITDTDTNVTVREALRYVIDLRKVDINNIISYTAPGVAKYIGNISYFILDSDEAKSIIQNEFDGQNTTMNNGTNVN